MLEIALNIQVKPKDLKKVLGHPWIWKQHVWVLFVTFYAHVSHFRLCYFLLEGFWHLAADISFIAFIHVKTLLHVLV